MGSSPMSITSIQLSSPLPSPSATSNQQGQDASCSDHHQRSVATSTQGTHAQRTILLPPLAFNPPSHSRSSLYPLVDASTPPELKRIRFTLDNQSTLLQDMENTSTATLLDGSNNSDLQHCQQEELQHLQDRKQGLRKPKKEKEKYQRPHSQNTSHSMMSGVKLEHDDDDNGVSVKFKGSEDMEDVCHESSQRKRPASTQLESSRTIIHPSSNSNHDYRSHGESQHNNDTISSETMTTPLTSTTTKGTRATAANHDALSTTAFTNSSQPLISLLPEFATHLPSADIVEPAIADSPNSALPSPVSDLDPDDENWSSATFHHLHRHQDHHLPSADTAMAANDTDPSVTRAIVATTTTTSTTTTNAMMEGIAHDDDTPMDEDMDSHSSTSTGSGENGLSPLLRTYDALPSDIQDYFMFQLLRRSAMPSLRFASDLIMQALKTDLIARFPRCISRRILLYLDARSLCRAAGVSRLWKRFIDADADLWRAKIVQAGFTVTATEIKRHRIAPEHLYHQYPHHAYSSQQKTLQQQQSKQQGPYIKTASTSSSFQLSDYTTSSASPSSSNSSSTSSSTSPAGSSSSSSPSSSSLAPKTINSTHPVTSPDLSPLKEMAHDGMGVDFSYQSLSDKPLLYTSNDPALLHRRALAMPDFDNERNDLDDSLIDSQCHPFKQIYKTHHIMRQNWKHNRVKRQQVKGQGNVVTCLQFDDDKIITGFDDNCINIHDIKTGTLRRVLHGHEGGVWALQYVGNTLVTGSTDRTVRVWDINRGICRFIFRGHTSTVRCLHIVMPVPVTIETHKKKKVVMQPSQPLIVSGSRDNTLRVWKLPYLPARSRQSSQHQQQSQYTDLDDAHEFDLRYRQPNNSTVTMMMNDHENMPTTNSQQLPVLPVASTLSSTGYSEVPSSQPSSSSSSSQLYQHSYPQSYPQQLQSQQPQQPQQPQQMYHHHKYQHSQEHDFNPFFIHLLKGHENSVRTLAAHGNTLASGSYDETVRIWDLEKGEEKFVLKGHTQRVYSVAIDAQRQLCISGSMDSSIRIWNMLDGHCERVLRGHTILVGLLGLTDRYLVSAAADASLRIWSTDSDECQHVLSGHKGAITSFQHDDLRVISGSEGGVKMWDIQTGEFVRDLIDDVNGVWRVAFDERRCVAAVKSNNITRLEILDYGTDTEDD